MKSLFRTLSLTLAAVTVAGIAVAAPKKATTTAGAKAKPSITLAKHTTHKKKHAHHKAKGHTAKMGSKMGGKMGSKTGGKMGSKTGGKMGSKTGGKMANPK
jgi:hypothetical protein